MALMEEIRSQGVAVVMITHDMRLVQEFASRVVVMSEGRVCFDGSPVGLFARGDVLEAANLCPTMLHQLMEALHREGVPVQGEIRNTADFLAGLGMQPGEGTL
jgi:energy-coupling factor transport system ATP-binding protein